MCDFLYTHSHTKSHIHSFSMKPLIIPHKRSQCRGSWSAQQKQQAKWEESRGKVLIFSKLKAIIHMGSKLPNPTLLFARKGFHLPTVLAWIIFKKGAQRAPENGWFNVWVVGIRWLFCLLWMGLLLLSSNEILYIFTENSVYISLVS